MLFSYLECYFKDVPLNLNNERIFQFLISLIVYARILSFLSIQVFFLLCLFVQVEEKMCYWIQKKNSRCSLTLLFFLPFSISHVSLYKVFLFQHVFMLHTNFHFKFFLSKRKINIFISNEILSLIIRSKRKF